MKTRIGHTVIIALLMMPVNVFAQQEIATIDQTDPDRSSRRKPRDLARQQLADLKNGAIMVRLQTKEHTLRALRAAGLDERADREERELRAKNKSIVQAFQTRFSFCPSYFFFSDQSEKVLKGRLNEVQFLNADLQVDRTIVFTHPTFLTAEFSLVTQDTAKYFSNHRTMINGNWSVERVPTYYGGTNMGFGGLIIKSDRLIQLQRPFPYYVRTFDMLRSVEKCVSKLNRKLLRYYSRIS